MMNITYTLCDASYDDMINILTFMANSKLYTHNLKKRYYYSQFKGYVKNAIKHLPKKDIVFSNQYYGTQIGTIFLGTYDKKKIFARFDVDNINELIVSEKINYTRMSLDELFPSLTVTSQIYSNINKEPANNKYAYPPIAVQIFGNAGTCAMIDGTHRVQNALHNKKNIEIYFLPFRQLKPSCFCTYYNYLLYLFYSSYEGMQSDILIPDEYHYFFQDLRVVLNQDGYMQ